MFLKGWIGFLKLEKGEIPVLGSERREGVGRLCWLRKNAISWLQA